MPHKNPEQFTDEFVQSFVRQVRENTGLEMAPVEGRRHLDYMCDLHCDEHPEHENLPLMELWPIVEARVNDSRDRFPAGPDPFGPPDESRSNIPPHRLL